MSNTRESAKKIQDVFNESDDWDFAPPEPPSASLLQLRALFSKKISSKKAASVEIGATTIDKKDEKDHERQEIERQIESRTAVLFQYNARPPPRTYDISRPLTTPLPKPPPILGSDIPSLSNVIHPVQLRSQDVGSAFDMGYGLPFASSLAALTPTSSTPTAASTPTATRGKRVQPAALFPSAGYLSHTRYYLPVNDFPVQKSPERHYMWLSNLSPPLTVQFSPPLVQIQPTSGANAMRKSPEPRPTKVSSLYTVELHLGSTSGNRYEQDSAVLVQKLLPTSALTSSGTATSDGAASLQNATVTTAGGDPSIEESSNAPTNSTSRFTTESNASKEPATIRPLPSPLPTLEELPPPVYLPFPVRDVLTDVTRIARNSASFPEYASNTQSAEDAFSASKAKAPYSTPSRAPPPPLTQAQAPPLPQQMESGASSANTFSSAVPPPPPLYTYTSIVPGARLLESGLAFLRSAVNPLQAQVFHGTELPESLRSIAEPYTVPLPLESGEWYAFREWQTAASVALVSTPSNTPTPVVGVTSLAADATTPSHETEPTLLPGTSGTSTGTPTASATPTSSPSLPPKAPSEVPWREQARLYMRLSSVRDEMCRRGEALRGALTHGTSHAMPPPWAYTLQSLRQQLQPLPLFGPTWVTGVAAAVTLLREAGLVTDLVAVCADIFSALFTAMVTELDFAMLALRKNIQAYFDTRRNIREYDSWKRSLAKNEGNGVSGAFSKQEGGRHESRQRKLQKTRYNVSDSALDGRSHGPLRPLSAALGEPTEYYTTQRGLAETQPGSMGALSTSGRSRYGRQASDRTVLSSLSTVADFSDASPIAFPDPTGETEPIPAAAAQQPFAVNPPNIDPSTTNMPPKTASTYYSFPNFQPYPISAPSVTVPFPQVPLRCLGPLKSLLRDTLAGVLNAASFTDWSLLLDPGAVAGASASAAPTSGIAGTGTGTTTSTTGISTGTFASAGLGTSVGSVAAATMSSAVPTGTTAAATVAPVRLATGKSGLNDSIAPDRAAQVGIPPLFF